MASNDGYRAGYVGVVGLPNSGKSTLVNALVGEKVSLVDEKQGVGRAEQGLKKVLQEEAEEVCQQSDLLLAVLNIDCDSQEKMDQVIEWVEQSKKPWVAIINKVDLPAKHRVLMLREKLSERGKAVMTASANNLGKDTKTELLGAIREHLPNSPQPLFSTDLFTPQSVRELCAEFIREKCFRLLKQEIPYGLAVRVMKYKEEKIPKIYAEILLAKPNYKSIVIGKDGELLKKIGSYARQDIEAFLGKKVFLDIHVTVKEKWMGNPMLMQELGYVVSN